MPRYDKYEPMGGGFRAPLAADFAYTNGTPDRNHANIDQVLGAGLNASGQVVIGAGQTGVVGALVLSKPKSAGEIVDVMTDGEIVEFANADGSAAAAGTVYNAADDGTVGTAAGTRIGHTVEATRLVVRVQPSAAAAVV